MWFFSTALGHPDCYPTWAFLPNGTRTPPAPLCNWPDTSCGCRTPLSEGVQPGNPGPQFPIYFSVKQCSENDIRVAYNLFYEKDGFAVGMGSNGHPWDWERVIVRWSHSDEGRRQAELILSQHSGYTHIPWPSIRSTISPSSLQLPKGGPDGLKNLDHPKVYVAWSKHPNYDHPDTKWRDIVSQSTPYAYRGQDWWTFVEGSEYVQSDRGSVVGGMMGGLEWGEADSTPVVVHEGLCGI
jgi:hypothetical protein